MFKEAIGYYSSYLELGNSIAISQFEKAETYLYLGQAHENVGDYKSAEINFTKPWIQLVTMKRLFIMYLYRMLKLETCRATILR